MALEEGTPVLSADGADLGKVSTIVADHGKDIFSGIGFRSGLLATEVFAPADLVDEITPEAVTLTIGTAEADHLGPYEG